MKILLIPTSESVERLRRVFDHVGSLPDKFAGEAFPLGMANFGNTVLDLFQREGEPVWKPLADRTQKEREFFGYGAAHPILVREGFLRRSLSDPSMGPQRVWAWQMDLVPFRESHQGGNVMEFEQPQPGKHIFRFGTQDDRFVFLDDKRHMTPRGNQQILLGYNIEQELVELMARMAKPDA